jgi:hypothetical protein
MVLEFAKSTVVLVIIGVLSTNVVGDFIVGLESLSLSHAVNNVAPANSITANENIFFITLSFSINNIH